MTNICNLSRDVFSNILSFMILDDIYLSLYKVNEDFRIYVEYFSRINCDVQNIDTSQLKYILAKKNISVDKLLHTIFNICYDCNLAEKYPTNEKSYQCSHCLKYNCHNCMGRECIDCDRLIICKQCFNKYHIDIHNSVCKECAANRKWCDKCNCFESYNCQCICRECYKRLSYECSGCGTLHCGHCDIGSVSTCLVCDTILMI